MLTLDPWKGQRKVEAETIDEGAKIDAKKDDDFILMKSKRNRRKNKTEKMVETATVEEAEHKIEKSDLAIEVR